MSGGEDDHVKSASRSLGSLQLQRLALKPGKPLAFGEVKGVPFLGLPGNPVAVLVAFILFGRPLTPLAAAVTAARPSGWHSFPLLAGLPALPKLGRERRAARVLCLTFGSILAP